MVHSCYINTLKGRFLTFSFLGWRKQMILDENSSTRHLSRAASLCCPQHLSQMLLPILLWPALPIWTASLVSLPWSTLFSFLGMLVFFFSLSSTSPPSALLSGCISMATPPSCFLAETDKHRRYMRSYAELTCQTWHFTTFLIPMSAVLLVKTILNQRCRKLAWKRYINPPPEGDESHLYCLPLFWLFSTAPSGCFPVQIKCKVKKKNTNKKKILNH